MEDEGELGSFPFGDVLGVCIVRFWGICFGGFCSDDETEGNLCDCVETNDCVSLYEFSCFVHNFFILVVIQR